ncbi:iron chelate uptake ABC transporter family permease subunit [Microbacterium sp. MEC084]|jgi:iron complex transport system permease protein|uniref:FecCD family ABC transporter permease n=1 Tax=Microbacterium sp. MEC084 TaxID=1963027 RepID=UPI0010705D38|nr:iron chelate uptake ABC transporter family permease subunit [Microbacterium sp. MEC084]MCD1267465.1 iron chelate uptake ABC transporter family permease subunit [Microbacterium sp. MEC084]
MIARSRRGLLLLAAAAVLLILAVLAGLAFGTRAIAPVTVADALLAYDPGDNDHVVVVTQRLPRTLIGLAAGLALAMAGALMQGITRNPLVDPGLLGVNAGASVAVLLAITLLGVVNPAGYVWFAFAGAALAAALAWAIGSAGADGASPAKLALTGAAVTAGLTSVMLFILSTSSTALNTFRFWSVGSLTGRGLDTLALVLPTIALGVAMAAVVASGLNLLALGDDTARGLGHSVRSTRAIALVATVLLCGSATAVAGPLMFVGLVVPHVVRGVVGSDYRWIVAASAPLGAALVILADVAGRLLSEIEAGLVVAFIGVPALLALVLQRKQATV